MYTAPRNGATIDRIYVHKNEGPESLNGANGLASYLDSIQGGYHRIRDDKYLVIKTNDDQIVYGAGGDNTHSLHICLIGWSKQTAAEWAADPYAKAEFEGAAQQVAQWCLLHQIPPTHVPAGAPGAAPTARGIAEHADDHDPNSEGHTDPGVGFPIEAFCARVATIMQPIDWNGIAQLVAWRKRVSAHALRYGHPGPDVKIMRDLLRLRGYGMPEGDEYDHRAVTVVEGFKVAHKLPNHDGRGFGKYPAAVIF